MTRSLFDWHLDFRLFAHAVRGGLVKVTVNLSSSIDRIKYTKIFYKK